ncbi:DUF2382 domain-containing protein [Streptomyces albofaciens JCM 4342]|uniref:PRC and DUF2382 domain-containing protein n=1 Tax=Streptomyces albofaciens TaxID=66866 RepID=UPI001239AB44|nr:PRC and DUF2382 domain-containing protein [Streptomyces albofaciens]KAA6213806.1 DUF2382 domain-containing protein [Streptomyces albofaciens JCM 4342]
MNAPLGENPQDLTGKNVVDKQGTKVGSIQQIYRDDATDAPEWITVRTGLFGMKETFVPLAGARRVGDECQVPYTKDQIKDAPRIDADGHLEPGEEERLYRHYGIARPGTAPSGTVPGRTTTTTGAGMGTAGAAGAPGMRPPEERRRERAESRPLAGAGAGAMAMSRGRDTDARSKEQNPEMIISEERVELGTEAHEAGHARLRKHVTTEEVHRTVPVSHDEAHIVREKISDEERRTGRTGQQKLGDGEVEVTLYEEQAVVRKENVPVERIRLETERVTEQQEVNTEVHREEVEFDDGKGTGRRGRRDRGGPEQGRGMGPGPGR